MDDTIKYIAQIRSVGVDIVLFDDILDGGLFEQELQNARLPSVIGTFDGVVFAYRG
jgi:hypothetical protein